jgi:hypothetical protein
MLKIPWKICQVMECPAAFSLKVRVRPVSKDSIIFCYSTTALVKQKAILENAAGLREKSTADFLESSGATVRQNYMDIANDSR